jgi:flavin-dependent dehydrogenase
MGAACEVAIVGGGPAGCATALALAQRGMSGVCLVAPDRGRPVALGETLLPDCRVLLERLGVLEGFLGEGHEPCLGTRSAWGSDTVGHNDFLMSVWGRGWHLDRERFDAFLLAEAEQAGTVVLRGTRFAGRASATDHGFHLRLAHADGERFGLSARFVVDASGSGAVFARTQRAHRVLRDRLMFVYGFFDGSDASSALRLTMVEAVETGWWYAAGLPEGRIAVAFAGDPDFVRRSALTQTDHWLTKLLGTRHIAGRLDGCRLVPPLVARVAPSGLCDPVCGERWLAVGDAAACYDPLSGQGIHKALADGIEAAEAVARGLGSGFENASDYAERVAGRFGAYRAERSDFYASESRWPDAPFWRRRREAAGA